MDITTATPVEIDTALAEIYTRLYATDDAIVKHWRFVTDLEQGIEKEADGNGMYTGYARMYGQKVLDLRTKITALNEERATILAETAPFENEFRARGGWSRFFLVQNNGGHIHSSMDCQTCNKRGQATRFGWLPNLSGQTEAEAVAEHGAILCTVCYPSAPTEWTDRHDDSVCPGSGAYYNPDLPHRGPRFYSGNWATCEGCGETVTMVKSGKIRKHKKA